MEEESTEAIFELNTHKPGSVKEPKQDENPEEVFFKIKNLAADTDQVLTKYSLDCLQKMHRKAADFSKHYKILYQCDFEGNQM